MSFEKPYRSLLFVPGSNQRALEKSHGLAADGLIYDLEDSVGAEDVARARRAVADQFALDRTGQSLFIRVNGIEDEAFADDAALVREVQPDGVVIPKVRSVADIDAAAAQLGDVPIWPMIETAASVLAVTQIADHPMVHGLILGPNDLSKELRVSGSTDRAEIMVSLQMTILAARAAGIVAIDGVFNRFKDDEGFVLEAAQGRDLGFDGKSLIHPNQIAPANAAFAPTKDEVARALKVVEAYEAAVAKGLSVAVLDGEMIEELHLDTARKLLAQNDFIENRNAKGDAT